MREMRLMRAIGEIDDKYVDEAAPDQNKSKAIHFGSWAKLAGIAACAVLVVGIGVIAVSRNVTVDTPVSQTTVSTDEFVQGGNPYQYFDTLEEAEKAVGFEINAADSWKDCAIGDYLVIDDRIIEISYNDADGNSAFTVRKAAGSEDISGDYNEYGDVIESNAENRSITMKGNDGKYYLALWNDNGYSYSVSANSGVSEEEMTEFIKSVK